MKAIYHTLEVEVLVVFTEYALVRRNGQSFIVSTADLQIG